MLQAIRIYMMMKKKKMMMMMKKKPTIPTEPTISMPQAIRMSTMKKKKKKKKNFHLQELECL
jgi:hypothetical protein